MALWDIRITKLFRKLYTKVSVIHKSTGHVVMEPFQGNIKGVRSSWRPQGALKEHQDALPRQPVPPLKQTTDRFLASVRPLLDDQQYTRATKLVDDLVCDAGQGHKLQELLEKRAKETENWLAEWWIKHHYLGKRLPISVNMNPTYTSPPMEQYVGDKGQIRCAAIVASTIIKHKIAIDSQTIPTEKIGGIPQCMMQHYHALGSTRVPAEGEDYIDTHHAHDPNPPRHVTVIHNNHLFHVDVFDEKKEPLNIEQIEAQLVDVVNQSQTRATPVGMLTNDHRDKWYRSYTELRKDSQNAENLDSIHKSLFVLSLDENVPGYTKDRHFEIQTHAHMTGGGSQLNSGNRWCDKTLQFFVNKTGGLGYGVEHSLVDGPIVMTILQKVLNNLKNPHLASQETPSSRTFQRPKRLDFNLTPVLHDAIKLAGAEIDKLQRQMDIARVHYTSYGSDDIRKMKMSSDGYLQALIQLAHFRLHGKLAMTEEACSLRMFRLGRVDWIRTVSIPMLNWCQAMTDSNCPQSQKLRLLREAVQYHRWNTKQVVQGQSVTGHLFGLETIALENNLELPEFFTDPIYKMDRSLITTMIPIEDGGCIITPPLSKDGYGILYNPQRRYINFGISAWNTSEMADIHKFSESLKNVLRDTLDLHVGANQETFFTA